MATVRYTVINGQIVAEKRDGVRKFYSSDALGSTVALYSGSAKADSFTYWPYGETRTSSGSTPTKYKFVGTLGCREQADGGIYMRARVEEPEDGRWMTVDPLWPVERAFEYANSSPSSAIDPTGWEWTFNPPWIVKPGPLRDAYIDCFKYIKDNFDGIPGCKGLSWPQLSVWLRCIMGCETADSPSNKDPFRTDAGGTTASESQGIGPCRLTTQNEYPYPNWQSNMCDNIKSGLSLLCKWLKKHPGGKPSDRGFPWRGSASCIKRCLNFIGPLR